ncbi:hypothetical protein K502DRAFT_161930 [Neoconidiobolus thromboides FSU 785]|nr:hypothetical protein K502DRAFT_161930 [Neoconidiobolus thromboides FSU 785]
MASDKKERKKEEHYRSEERPAVSYKAPRKSSKPSIKPASSNFENTWDNSVSNYQCYLNKKPSKELKYSNESGNLLPNFDKISSVKNNEGNYKGGVFFEDNSKQERREGPNGWEHYNESWYKEEASFDPQYQMKERNQAYEHFQSEKGSVDAELNKDSNIKNYPNMNDDIQYKSEDEAKGLNYSLKQENVNYKVDGLNNGSQGIIREVDFTSDDDFDKSSVVDNGIRHVRRYSDKRPNLGGLRLGLSNKSETDEERDNQENVRFDHDGNFEEIKDDDQSIGDIKFDSHSFGDDFEEIRLNPQADDNSVSEKVVEGFDQSNYNGYKSDMSDDSIKLDNLDLNSDESYHDWRNNLLSKHIKEDEEITIRYEPSFGFQNGAKALQFNEGSNTNSKKNRDNRIHLAS